VHLFKIDPVSGPGKDESIDSACPVFVAGI